MLGRFGFLIFRTGVGGTVAGYAVGLGLLARWGLGIPGPAVLAGAAGAAGVIAGLLARRLTDTCLGSRWDRVQFVALFPAYLLIIPFAIWEDWVAPYFWPRTVDQAVHRVLGWLGRRGRDQLRELPEADLPMLHFGLGLSIRNEFGLWGGNRALLADCACEDADAASGVILGRVLQRVRV